MSELEEIGRYHQLAAQLPHKLNARNDLLFRASVVLKAAAEERRGYGVVGKKCNFEAVERMTAQARVIHAEIETVIEEMNALAPIVNQPALRLA